MNMELGFLKTIPKKGLIGIVAGVVVTVTVAACVFLLNREEDYREIKVYEVDGNVVVDRPKIGAMDAYVNMQLQSEDEVDVFSESYLQLKLDEDKYVLIEPGSHVSLESSGNAQDSRTKLYLQEGAIVNHIENPLSKDSSYEVNTPNSTMAVRGTSFRVEVTYDENGVSHTSLSVYEGTVECHLVFPDGSIDENGVFVKDGEEIRMWGNNEDSDYEGEYQLEYEPLRKKVLEFLGVCIRERKAHFTITLEELEELIEDKEESEEESEEAGQNDDIQEDKVVSSGDEDTEKEDTPAGEEPSQGETKEQQETPEEDTTVSEGTTEEETETTNTTYTVTFIYDGFTLATKEVGKGQTVSKPLLQPTSTGSWDFNFSTPITNNITIYWLSK